MAEDTPVVVDAQDPLLNLAVRRIVERFGPLRIVLFGSRARGEAGRWSDIDLLVVLPEVSDKRRTTVEVLGVLSDLPIAKDVVVTSPSEIESRGQVVGSVLRAALHEGKVIYERT